MIPGSIHLFAYSDRMDVIYNDNRASKDEDCGMITSRKGLPLNSSSYECCLDE